VLAVDVFGPPEAESPECSDGLDNDGDGQLDGEDPDCQRVQAEPPEADCADGVDNDADGRVDLEDRGCASRIALSMAPRKLVDGLILGVASPGGGAGETFAFHRADANGDGKGNITDAVYLLNYLHVPGLEPVCLEAADVDDDGAVGAADVIFLLSWLFVDGERPPPSPGPWPFPCGPDPVTSPRMLGCKAYSGC
jgi:hypothetical protein